MNDLFWFCCFFLDFLLIAVIFLTKKLHMNPDNLATPFAASIGDIVSLLLLSFFASLIYSIHGNLLKLRIYPKYTKWY